MMVAFAVKSRDDIGMILLQTASLAACTCTSTQCNEGMHAMMVAIPANSRDDMGVTGDALEDNNRHIVGVPQYASGMHGNPQRAIDLPHKP